MQRKEGHPRVPFVMGPAMSFGRVQPAHIDFSEPGVARAPDFGDIYHPRSGALAQARHVFLAGNDLPARWRGRPRFVVLETGFGLGHNFLATWAAWRDDPQRPDRLWFLSLDRHPPTRDDLQRAHAASALPALAGELQSAWPPATPDIHRMAFEGDRVTLLLALGDVAAVLPQWVAQVDAFYLDGFTPARNPAMWDPQWLRHLPRLAAPGATLATWSAAHALRETLAAQGFDVRLAPGQGGKREITLARFAPRFQAPAPPGRQAAPRARSALVIGAGLAGAATAHALAAQGVDCTVLEAEAGPAQCTSGNAGGLFHGVVHAGDAPHARWFRACALAAERRLRPLVDAGRLPGAVQGLLRLEATLDGPAMRQRLLHAGLPPEFVQALDAQAFGRLAGLDTPVAPAWFYPGGGWVNPAALTAWLLQADGIRCHFQAPVQHIAATAQGWRAVLAHGRGAFDADLLVLAAAHQAQGLAAPFAGSAWPGLQRVRGQLTQLPAALHPGLRLDRPLAGAGYALSLDDGSLLCGATAQEGDEDPKLRAADHHINLDRLAALTGWPMEGLDAATLPGRVGWRLLAPDRLPLLGPVPAAGAVSARLDQARHLPRVPGLYVHTALGSRGIAQSLLGGEVLASWITGAPVPLPSALLDTVDVARFAARLARQS